MLDQKRIASAESLQTVSKPTQNHGDSQLAFQAVQKNKFVIYRNSMLRVAWDFILTILAMYSAFEGPLTVALNSQFNSFEYKIEKYSASLTAIAVISLVIDTCFFLDVVINFFTSFFVPAEELEVYDLKRIANTYLRTWFILDVLCSVPFELCFYFAERATAFNILIEIAQALLRCFKIYKIIKLSRQFKQGDETMTVGKIFYMRFSRNQRRVFALLVAVVFISHVVACLWVAEANLALGTVHQTWVQAYQQEAANSMFAEYSAAFYWVVQTMTTVGYGDVEPANDLERVVGILVMLLSALFWGYIVASMASIINSFSRQSEKAEKYMEQISFYLKEKAYPRALRRKIKHYYRHFYYKRNTLDEVGFLENLSPLLQTQVSDFLLSNVKGRMLCATSQFNDLDRRELSLFTMIMKPQFFEAGDRICEPAARLHHIFFVASGDVFALSPLDANVPVITLDPTAAVKTYQEVVQLFTSRSDSQFTTAVYPSIEKKTNIRWALLKQGECFGAYEALTLKVARLPVVATTSAELFAISRQDLEHHFRLKTEVLSNIITRVRIEYINMAEQFRAMLAESKNLDSLTGKYVTICSQHVQLHHCSQSKQIPRSK